MIKIRATIPSSSTAPPPAATPAIRTVFDLDFGAVDGKAKVGEVWLLLTLVVVVGAAVGTGAGVGVGEGEGEEIDLGELVGAGVGVGAGDGDGAGALTVTVPEPFWQLGLLGQVPLKLTLAVIGAVVTDPPVDTTKEP